MLLGACNAYLEGANFHRIVYKQFSLRERRPTGDAIIEDAVDGWCVKYLQSKTNTTYRTFADIEALPVGRFLPFETPEDQRWVKITNGLKKKPGKTWHARRIAPGRLYRWCWDSFEQVCSRFGIMMRRISGWIAAEFFCCWKTERPNLVTLTKKHSNPWQKQ